MLILMSAVDIEQVSADGTVAPAPAVVAPLAGRAAAESSGAEVALIAAEASTPTSR